jgi:hypothetical protein
MIEPSARELQALRRVYGGAARDLARLLKGTDFQRGKAATLLAQVDGISKRLGLATDGWVEKNVGRTVERAGRAAEAWTRKATARKGRTLKPLSAPSFEAPAALGEGDRAALGGGFLRIHEEAVRVLTRHMAGDLALANRAAADRVRRVIRTTGQKVVGDAEVREVLARGLVAGGSLARIERGLKARLTEEGRALVDSGKLTPAEARDLIDVEQGTITVGSRTFDLSYYVHLVADTGLREAAVQATCDRLEAVGREAGDPLLFDLVVVTGPVADDACDDYRGKVFSISGKHPDYPALDDIDGPPFHPNCRHAIAPFDEGLATAEERASAQMEVRTPEGPRRLKDALRSR